MVQIKNEKSFKFLCEGRWANTYSNRVYLFGLWLIIINYVYHNYIAFFLFSSFLFSLPEGELLFIVSLSI